MKLTLLIDCFMEGYFNLTKTSLNNLFPFFIELNEDLIIVACGKSIKKIFGDITGKQFNDLFEIIRPKFNFSLSYDSFTKNTNKLIVFQTKKTKFLHKFKGDFFVEDSKNKLFILSTPWLTNASELKPYNLDLNDFAIHDALPDQIQLLSSMEIINNDFKIINEQLKSNQDKLREKQQAIEEIALIPDENPNPILRISFNGQLQYANQSARNIFGNLNAWIEINLEENINERDKMKISEDYFLHDEQHFLAIFVPILDKEYFNVYFINNTKTLLFEKTLTTTNERLDKLINNIGVGILVENASRQILLTNTMFCSLFSINIEPALLLGADCSNSAEESKGFFKDEENFIHRIHEIIANKTAVYGDILYLKDGRIFERDFIPLSEDNEYAGHIWKYQDITQVIRNKESLKRVEEKYKRIIENFGLALIEVDLNEVITKVYPSCTTLTGYSKKELLGENARKLLVDQGRGNHIFDEQNEKRKEGKSSVYEVQIKTKSGENKLIILCGAPIYNVDNEIVGSIGIHFDITKRKNMENDLKIAKEEALSYVKAKELFIAKISHEIRTPMNVILGMSNLMKESLKDTEHANLINAIKTSADNLLGIINNILDFSDLNRDEFSLNKENFNLINLVDHLNLFFSQETQKKNLGWQINLDPKIHPVIKGDKIKINQVLINLINNAIKFTERGSVQLSISLINKSKTDQKIRFEIIDSGIGIASEFQDRIFTDFSQENDSISPQYGGTGLGLAISNEIISNMGGKIQFTSEKMKGSNFYFELNFDIITDKIDINLPEKVKILEDIRILIAEDNPLNQLLLKSIFEKANIKHEIVSNGKILIESLLNDEYDIVLLDVQMPVMDGLTAIKAIRKDLKSSIPVIAISANASKEDEKNYLQLGMNGVLSKPFLQDDLFKLINMLLPAKHLNNSNNSKLIQQDIEQASPNYSLTTILDICNGDSVFLNELLKTLIENTTRLSDNIKLNAKDLEIDKIKFNVHQLKSTLRSINAEEALKDVLKIETMMDNVIDNEHLIELSESLAEKISQILASISKDYF